MSLNEHYDDNNIFARIIRGELPAAKIFEDDKTLAFMDAFPEARGHSLVISKTARAVNFLDLPTKDLGRVIGRAQKIAHATQKALNPDGIRLLQFSGSSAGQTVFHTHFHIIPTFEAAPESDHGKGQAEMSELEELAKKIRERL